MCFIYPNIKIVFSIRWLLCLISRDCLLPKLLCMDEKEEEEEEEEEITRQRSHGPRAAASRLHGMSKRRPWASAEGA